MGCAILRNAPGKLLPRHQIEEGEKAEAGGQGVGSRKSGPERREERRREGREGLREEGGKQEKELWREERKESGGREEGQAQDRQQTQFGCARNAHPWIVGATHALTVYLEHSGLQARGVPISPPASYHHH